MARALLYQENVNKLFSDLKKSNLKKKTFLLV